MNWKDFKAIRYGAVKVLAWYLLGGKKTSPPPPPSFSLLLSKKSEP